MKHFLLAVCLSLVCLPAMAADRLAYETRSLKLFNQVRLLIPQDTQADRIYIQSRFRKPVVGAMAQVDEQTLVRAIGTTKTTSVPLELARQSGSRLTEVIVFPRAPLKEAKESIILAFQMENGREKRITLKGKRLADLLENLH